MLYFTGITQQVGDCIYSELQVLMGTHKYLSKLTGIQMEFRFRPCISPAVQVHTTEQQPYPPGGFKRLVRTLLFLLMCTTVPKLLFTGDKIDPSDKEWIFYVG